MSRLFATGKHAWALCQRCGMRGRYTAMVDDQYKPGLRVHPECLDAKHPAEKPIAVEDAIALRKPSPDIDDDSPGGDNGSLADYFDDLGERYFGGGT